MTLKEFRKEYRLSQAALARAIGVTAGTIWQIETGRIRLSGNIAAKVWEVYGVALELPEGAGPSRKTMAPKVDYANEIVIQSPLGGEITPEQITAKVPAGADCVFVRVDQNKLWWIRGEDTGNVDIWD